MGLWHRGIMILDVSSFDRDTIFDMIYKPNVDNLFPGLNPVNRVKCNIDVMDIVGSTTPTKKYY